MPELPFAITAQDQEDLITQMQLLFNDLYEERLGGANVGDVFEIGDDDVFKIRLLTSGGLEKSGSQLKVMADTSNGIELSSNGVKIKIKANSGAATDSNGLYVLIKADNGIAVDSNGIYVKLKASYGIDVDSDGLKLKQQAAVTDASAASSLTLDTGSDSVDRAGFNTKLATLVSEINAIKDTLNTVITRLENAEVIAT